ncbi:MAG: DJ-1/PfpI family protein [Verrucomicrobiota bacterium]
MNQYEAVHVAGGRGATFDLFRARTWQGARAFLAREKVVGAICHGAIALGNNPERLRGRKVTGYTLEGDQALQQMSARLPHPHYPQTSSRKRGGTYSRVGKDDPYVIRDGRLVTGQTSNRPSEYGLVLLRAIAGKSPVVES